MKDRVLLMFLEGIKEINKDIETIILFGSRARKTFRPDSDYDLLVVVKNKAIRDRLYDIAVDVFCKTGADISLKIFKKDDFDRAKSIPTPFMENVLKEGLRVG